ncbi:tRNA (adenosine(37)-N6)-threonylcarbamoyltransferase complex dimerization subunit type 1 TsaB [Synechococcus sp. Tobar12-5m-g]|uniref:tRNA (adenosine(37)-N6)-threonylcarbamoyltransferase complex dimerization subunit type 1 TsaB n=1 Tax=unclassified Synechococcus TaxID=2626047 RepID=UPI0020CE179D|nr:MULTISPECIES: tRNA (adenosine(37)-N6)-threonylcarbamoyltransferase complex dimerization subunit type 1 TsaB [unclassified Synechococcus]MCP9772535.1 tRNA (adenosine(37)-N6)-threonylcarbamoyltransferase complex dimerization subunit type 1 TsaB [Synechococcus sp. Tobar12-5m-g]MCP9873374.1 tRNA (adenosine(37)-N6)-threonylcarbamoyltransferase complex dimerization subunit type 1 TsaB [Synechococcus sp. Cruz CV-v-12]
MSDVLPWLLALHSSSDTLAVGLQPLGGGAATLATHPLGRSLGNDLLACVEQLLPASRWRELGRLAVATGPGGFTGTRLTVVLARTLAQQLDRPLDGFSSFLLIARRLWLAGEAGARGEPFWITQTLPRRGLVAGRYQADPVALGGLAEDEVPRLFSAPATLAGQACFEARVDASADLTQLLLLSQAAAVAGWPAPWQPVLPIYPTSPVATA